MAGKGCVLLAVADALNALASEPTAVCLSLRV
jgi:hypothetical protein